MRLTSLGGRVALPCANLAFLPLCRFGSLLAKRRSGPLGQMRYRSFLSRGFCRLLDIFTGCLSLF